MQTIEAQEIIPDKLYFSVLTHQPVESDEIHYFSIDDQLFYEPFFKDFGPLHLGCVYKFCELMKIKLQIPKTILFYCCPSPTYRSNAACLIALYSVIVLNRSPRAAYATIQALEPFCPYRDAGNGISEYALTVEHVVYGVAKAKSLKFFDFRTFDVQEYEHYEQVENGDLNVIIPNQFLHMASPSDKGLFSFKPAQYLPIFKKFNVKTVIRLNKKTYDKKVFLQNGIDHHDLFFTDGTNPSQKIIDKFLKICANAVTKGTIAIHCKAGLGRTGTLVALYMMKHWRFTDTEAIAWLRICRPGSVVGPQQQFVRDHKAAMWKLGLSLPSRETYKSANMSKMKIGHVGARQALRSTSFREVFNMNATMQGENKVLSPHRRTKSTGSVTTRPCLKPKAPVIPSDLKIGKQISWWNSPMQTSSEVIIPAQPRKKRSPSGSPRTTELSLEGSDDKRPNTDPGLSYYRTLDARRQAVPVEDQSNLSQENADIPAYRLGPVTRSMTKLSKISNTSYPRSTRENIPASGLHEVDPEIHKLEQDFCAQSLLSTGREEDYQDY